MINIIREETAPASLETQEIKDYLDALALHKEDSINPEPNKPAYRNADLLEAFDRCFFKKCYLTEKKFDSSWEMDVEHFVSKTENPALRYTWSNLFPADHDANMMKPRNTPEGGYLNPCHPDNDVEKDIFYLLTTDGTTINFKSRDPQNIKANNTASLLKRLHNGHDYNSTKKTEGLRNAIRKKTRNILSLIVKWQSLDNGTIEKEQVAFELKSILSRKSSYTMFCRSMPEVIHYVPIDFLD